MNGFNMTRQSSCPPLDAINDIGSCTTTTSNPHNDNNKDNNNNCINNTTSSASDDEISSLLHSLLLKYHNREPSLRVIFNNNDPKLRHMLHRLGIMDRAFLGMHGLQQMVDSSRQEESSHPDYHDKLHALSSSSSPVSYPETLKSIYQMYLSFPNGRIILLEALLKKWRELLCFGVDAEEQRGPDDDAQHHDPSRHLELPNEQKHLVGTRNAIANLSFHEPPLLNRSLKEEIQNMLFRIVRWRDLYQCHMGTDRNAATAATEQDTTEELDGAPVSTAENDQGNHDNGAPLTSPTTINLTNEQFQQHLQQITSLLIQLGDLDILETLFSAAQFLGQDTLVRTLHSTISHVNQNVEKQFQDPMDEFSGKMPISRTASILRSTLPLQLVTCIAEFVSHDSGAHSFEHQEFVRLIEHKINMTMSLLSRESQPDGHATKTQQSSSRDLNSASSSQSASTRPLVFYSMSSTYSENGEDPISDFPGLVKVLVQIAQQCPQDASHYFGLIHCLLRDVTDESILSSMNLVFDMQIKYSHSVRAGLESCIMSLYGLNRDGSTKPDSSLTDSSFIHKQTALWHATSIFMLLTACRNQMMKSEGLQAVTKLVEHISKSCKFSIPNPTQYLNRIFHLLCQRGSIVCELLMELSIRWCNSDGFLCNLGEEILFHLFSSLPESRRIIFASLFQIIHQRPEQDRKLQCVQIMQRIITENPHATTHLNDVHSVIEEGLSKLTEYPKPVTAALLQLFIPQSFSLPVLKNFLFIHLTKHLRSRDSFRCNMALFGLCQYLAHCLRLGREARAQNEVELLHILRPLFHSHTGMRRILYQSLTDSLKSLSPTAAVILYQYLSESFDSLIPLKTVPAWSRNSTTEQKYQLDLAHICSYSQHSTNIQPTAEMLHLLVLIYPTLCEEEVIIKITTMYLHLTYQLLDTDWVMEQIRDENHGTTHLLALLPIYEHFLHLLSANHPLKLIIVRRIPNAPSDLFANYISLALKLYLKLNCAENQNVQNEYHCMMSMQACLKLLVAHKDTLASQLKLVNSSLGNAKRNRATPGMTSQSPLYKLPWMVLELTQLVRVFRIHALRNSFQTLNQKQFVFNILSEIYGLCCQIPPLDEFGWESDLLYQMKEMSILSDDQRYQLNEPDWASFRLKALCLRLMTHLIQLENRLDWSKLYECVNVTANEHAYPLHLYCKLIQHFQKAFDSDIEEGAIDSPAYIALMTECVLQKDQLENTPHALLSVAAKSTFDFLCKHMNTSGSKSILKLLLEYCPHSVRQKYVKQIIVHMHHYCSPSSHRTAKSMFSKESAFLAAVRVLTSFFSRDSDGLTAETLESFLELANTVNDTVNLVSKLERMLDRVVVANYQRVKDLNNELRNRGGKHLDDNKTAEEKPNLDVQVLSDHVHLAKLIYRILNQKHNGELHYTVNAMLKLVKHYNQYVDLLKKSVKVMQKRSILRKLSHWMEEELADMQHFDESLILISKKRKHMPLTRAAPKRKKQRTIFRSNNEYIDRHLAEVGNEDTFEDLKNFIA